MKQTYLIALLFFTFIIQLNAELSCPDVDNGEPVFLPSDTNCGEYFVCVHGVPVLMECPEGLYWDQSLNVCNWPDLVVPPCTGMFYVGSFYLKDM